MSYPNRLTIAHAYALVSTLLEQYRQQPDQTSESITALSRYQNFVEYAALYGFINQEMDVDEEFASRLPEWVQTASMDELRRWVCSLIRADRWQGEWPSAILEALQGGQFEVLERRLAAMLPTASNIAKWMASQLEISTHIYQDTTASEIMRQFGEQFVYKNSNGNLAIGKDVLKCFRELTEGKVQWERGNKAWKKLKDGEEYLGRQTD